MGPKQIPFMECVAIGVDKVRASIDRAIVAAAG